MTLRFTVVRADVTVQIGPSSQMNVKVPRYIQVNEHLFFFPCRRALVGGPGGGKRTPHAPSLCGAVMHETTAETSSEHCLHSSNERQPTWPRRIHIDLFHGPNLNPRSEPMDRALLFALNKLGSAAVS
jgi:hypothetical protein